MVTFEGFISKALPHEELKVLRLLEHGELKPVVRQAKGGTWLRSVEGSFGGSSFVLFSIVQGVFLGFCGFLNFWRETMRNMEGGLKIFLLKIVRQMMCS